MEFQRNSSHTTRTQRCQFNRQQFDAAGAVRDLRALPIPADEMPMYKRKGSQVADKLVGKLWTKEFLAKVRAIIKKTRAEKKNAKKK